ncbi:OB-fold-containig protein [Catenovulum sediminis]|uniref:OB-fold-containig protein n=1 Tax=Catenovulum sediminis TaxID=1740262 RepID=UPI001180E8DE|nr:OB-fold-containig protein [Catenovulum sediminis]
MLEFLLADANVIYSSALALLLALAIFEGGAQLVGFGILSLVDDALPDIDLQSEMDAASLGTLAALMSWLNLGRLPFMMWLTLFLSSFAISGLAIQMLSIKLSNTFLPNLLALPLCLFFTVFSLHHLGHKLLQVLPKNESSAVSHQTFIGMAGRIIRGTARADFPAEAEIVDQFKQKHFVMVAPEAHELPTGCQIVIVERSAGGHYIARPLDI